jgi:subtilisin-like proprotein convertase family protein
MKQFFNILFAMFFATAMYGQTYVMSVATASATTCGGTIYDSGGAGGNYGNSQDRTFNLFPGTAGQAIRITFTSFNTESATFGWNDYVEIFNNGVSMGRFEGTSLPGTFTSTALNGSLSIVFHSDGSTTRSGFAASISCVALNPSINMPASGSATLCAGNFYDTGGPSSDYSNNEDRTFTICPATAGQATRVNFSAFETENCGSGCDFLYIYDGNSTSAPLIGAYYNTTSPGIVTASTINPTGCLTFRFTSDGSSVFGSTDPGWAASISCAPPVPPTLTMPPSVTTVTTCSGTFYDSGGASEDYSNNENRTLTICPTTAGNRVGANFTSFDTERNYDYLYVYDGPNTSSPSLGVYTGTLGPGQVRATPNNPTGCITFRFVSDGSSLFGSRRPGWRADLSCLTPCPTILTSIVSSTPAKQADNVIRVCQGATVNFVGTATFTPSGTVGTATWSFGDGTTASGLNASKTFSTPGSYVVNLTVRDPTGCPSTNLINQLVQVSSTPTMGTTVTPASVCVGRPATLTGSATPTPVIVNCTPPISTPTYLPDGSGVSYSTSINVNCYSAAQSITSASDIANICMTLEHSYLGDLNIRIICPTGKSTVLKSYGSGGSTLYLGNPNDDPSTVVGVGANYCFATSGATNMVAGSTITTGNPAGASIQTGTYRPEESYANLIGCPANGAWTIEITDNLAQDDGTIFDWDLNFGASLVPATSNSFTPTIASSTWQAASGLTNVNATTATVTPTIAGANNYTYQMVDNFGCTYTRPATLTAIAAPTPTIAASVGALCAGQSSTLTAGGGTSYTWSTGSNANPISVSPTTTTTYSVTATNAAGCTSVTSFTVTVNTPSVTITPASAAICPGQTTTLTASGGTSYLWSTSQNTAAINVSPGTTTTYTVTATTAGCPTVASRSVTVNPAPTPTIAGTSTICLGGNTTLTASGGTSYLWSNSQNTAATTVSPIINTTYTVTATNAFSCTATASQAVTVNTVSTPPIPALVPGTVCPNTNLVLSATGGTAGLGSLIQWYSGVAGSGTYLGSGTNVTVNPTTTTTYYVRREGSCNTTADASVVVSVKNFVYALNGTTTNLYCTDNAGWKHFFVGNEIILSVQGDLSGALPGFPIATIYDNNAYRQSPNVVPTPNCTNTALAVEEKFEMARAWNLNFGLGTLNPPYDVRFYYKPTEKTAIETAATNWKTTYAACNYAYKYATPLGFYWFKNTAGAYVPPMYDGLHLTASSTGMAGATNYGQLTGITSFSGGSGAVILVPTVLLAIDFKQFTGENKGKFNRLNWITASETNNLRYEVERSNDGINFHKIGEVAAQTGGNPEQERAYRFDDMNPLIGTNYYRLRQVGTDGNTNLSDILTIDLNSVNSNYLFLPNPTETFVNYQVQTLEAEEVQITVSDMLGRQLSSNVYQSVAGFNTFAVDMSNLAAGSYLVRALHKGSQTVNSKVITKAGK